MTDLTAQEAYEEAVRRIRTWQPGEVLDLAINGLMEIPACIREIEPTELVLTYFSFERQNYVGAAQLSDLSPLAGVTSLKRFMLSRTIVSDLSPLAGLTALEDLNCSHTPVSDLGHSRASPPCRALTAARPKSATLDRFRNCLTWSHLKHSDVKSIKGRKSCFVVSK